MGTAHTKNNFQVILKISRQNYRNFHISKQFVSTGANRNNTNAKYFLSNSKILCSKVKNKE